MVYCYYRSASLHGGHSGVGALRDDGAGGPAEVPAHDDVLDERVRLCLRLFLFLFLFLFRLSVSRLLLLSRCRCSAGLLDFACVFAVRLRLSVRSDLSYRALPELRRLRAYLRTRTFQVSQVNQSAQTFKMSRVN